MARKPSTVVCLLAATVVVLACATGVSWLSGGLWGLLACVSAAAICLIGGVLGMLIASPFGTNGQPFVQVCLMMLVRSGFALGSCLLISLSDGPLFRSGFVYYLLVFYLLGLALETVMLVRTVGAHRA